MMSSEKVTKGLVSVIIPVYNRVRLLREAADSVLDQSYRPIEVIIVDDGSTDEGSIREIKSLVDANPDVVRSICILNSGPGLARQAGLELAQGEFIQFLDSDDLLLPWKLGKQVEGLRRHPECSVSYGKTREYVMGETPRNIPSRRTGERFEELYPATLIGRIWTTETPLYRKSALDEIGPWSGLRVLEDWEYECRLGARRARIHYCNEFVSDHRHHFGTREGLRWKDDASVFKDMLTAHIKVLEYAQAAGVEENTPEMRYFARNLFRLTREAGSKGLSDEAGKMLSLAVKIDPRREREYRHYQKCAELIGWRNIARWSEKLASMRRNGIWK